MSGDALRALAALGHSPVENTRCMASVNPSPPENRPPGPANPPMACCLKVGHEGPHRYSFGCGPSVPFRSADDVVFRVPFDTCTKCRTRWPCEDAQKVIGALNDKIALTLQSRRAGKKAAHVMRQGTGDGKHTCHWPGCGKSVPPAMWGCRVHWFRLPIEIRNLIWRTYRPGQETSKTPSAEYVEAAKAALLWIKANAK